MSLQVIKNKTSMETKKFVHQGVPGLPDAPAAGAFPGHSAAAPFSLLCLPVTICREIFLNFMLPGNSIAAASTKLDFFRYGRSTG
jgi:hypothetical protein